MIWTYLILCSFLLQSKNTQFHDDEQGVHNERVGHPTPKYRTINILIVDHDEQGVHNARLGQPATKFGGGRRMGPEKWAGLGAGDENDLLIAKVAVFMIRVENDIDNYTEIGGKRELWF